MLPRYLVFWTRARVLEVTALPVVGVLCAVLGSRDLPAVLFRPGLAPEQMIQLLSALFAACVVLAVRRGGDARERLAAVALVPRRASWVALVLTVATAVTIVVCWTLPDDLGLTHARNTTAYVGVGLVLEALSLAAALAVPWVWFTLASTVGQRSVQGATLAEWWAYPVQDASWHPTAAAALLVVGVAVRLSRA